MGSVTTTIMRISDDQKLRTKVQEGLRLIAYQDTQDPPHWAIGYGHDESNPRAVRGMLNGEFYQGPPCRGLTITKEEADRLFDGDVDDVERGISKAVTVDLSQGQMDSCGDFCFHYGLERFRQSTLLQKINFNPHNLKEILPQFARWNINAGRRDKAIYMRSLRRACVYAGVVIPQKLWEPVRFPWAVTGDDHIDYSITPDVFQIVEWGRKGVEPYKFDPAKPLPKPQEDLILTRELPPETRQEPRGSVSDVGGSVAAQEPEASARPDQPAEAVRPVPGEVASPLGPDPAKPIQDSAPSVSVPVESGVAEEPPPSNASPAVPPAAAPKAHEAEKRHPAKSATLWGGLFTALAPQFDQIGQMLMAKSGQFGPPFLVLGIIMIVLGRIGAVQPLSSLAPSRSPQ